MLDGSDVGGKAGVYINTTAICPKVSPTSDKEGINHGVYRYKKIALLTRIHRLVHQLVKFLGGKKGKKATTCEALICSGNPDVGGHVIKSGEGSKEYILPICYSCNNKPDDESYKAWESDLVSVN